ncbi:MAG: sulfur carrier protein ThiS, partial [Pelodictyon phaeoclathratiforme]
CRVGGIWPDMFRGMIAGLVGRYHGISPRMIHSMAQFDDKRNNEEMAQMITIELNGQQQPLPAGSAVNDLLSIIGSDGKSVAVVVNQQIIRPENRSTRLLQEGDQVELLIFAGGG